MATIKKYNGSTWENTIARKYETKSEIIVPPTTIYADGSNITTYSIKGNTVQNGTPTPTNPIAVNGVGELVGSDYQIPISSGGVTTNIYLGSTQTVRQIKKVVLTGNESGWTMGTSQFGKRFGYTLTSSMESTIDMVRSVCSHVPLTHSGGTYSNPNTYTIGSNQVFNISLDASYTTLDQFLDWLKAQYSAGTPVTVWYVLASPETGIVNEPLMKIGTYADTLSNAASIPTTEGANSITVDTTVQPSEFTATWTGWHDASVKEWDGSDWQ